jgi:hypothetical protein
VEDFEDVVVVAVERVVDIVEDFADIEADVVGIEDFVDNEEFHWDVVELDNGPKKILIHLLLKNVIKIY